MKPRFDFDKGKLISYDGEVIQFAGSSKIEKYSDQIEEIMSLFNLKKGEYLVTDESKISDFGKDTINILRLAKFKKKYKFSVMNKDFLYKIAQRMYSYRPF